jgi:predicted transposase YdaD
MLTKLAPIPLYSYNPRYGRTAHQPHDRFFKEIFSRQETARDFLQPYLPPQVSALLNFDSLEDIIGNNLRVEYHHPQPSFQLFNLDG